MQLLVLPVAVGLLVSCAEAAPRVEVARTTRTPVVEAAEPPAEEPPETSAPGVPDHLRDLLLEALPGARLTAHASAPDAGVVTVVWRSVRLAFPYGPNATDIYSVTESLDAVKLVQALSDAGAMLHRTSRVLFTATGDPVSCGLGDATDRRTIECRIPRPSIVQETTPATTDELSPYSLPPSRRPARRPVRRPARRPARRPVPPSRTGPRGSPARPPLASGDAVDAIVAALGAHPDISIAGVALDDQHRLVLMTAGDYGYDVHGVLACIAYRQPTAHALDCVPSGLSSVDASLGGRGAGWLVTESVSASRDSLRSLRALTIGEAGLIVDTIDLGGMAGDGEACGTRPGYCVLMDAHPYTVRVVAPDCVERRPEDAWSAMHVRMGDTWIRETIESAPDCVERFAIEAGRFVRRACGPAQTAATCEAP